MSTVTIPRTEVTRWPRPRFEVFPLGDRQPYLYGPPGRRTLCRHPRARAASRAAASGRLAEHVQQSLMDTAAAVSAGGRAPEEVRDLVSRVGHAKFDLVIMNPPFTRSGGTEGKTLGAGNAAFAAFNTTRATQKKMQTSLVALRGADPVASGNAGLAADFLELAMRKARPDGTIALVLPLSAVSGGEWERARRVLAERYRDITVVTIAGAGSFDASFSADTGMAECLVVAQQGAKDSERRGTFVLLHRKVRSATEGELLATEITGIREAGDVRRLEGIDGLTDIWP